MYGVLYALFITSCCGNIIDAINAWGIAFDYFHYNFYYGVSVTVSRDP